MNRLAQDFERYHQNINELYANTTANVTGIEEHRRCTDAIDKAMEVLGVYQMITELAVNMTISDTMPKAYTYAIQIPPLFVTTKKSFTDQQLREIDRNVTRKCEWLYQKRYTTEDQYRGLDEEFDNLEDMTSNINRLVKTVAPLFDNLNNELCCKMSIFTGTGQEYLDGRITKLKLSHKFASTLFLKYRENVADLKHEMEEFVKEYKEEMTNAMEKLKDYYRKILDLELPVINNYNVYQLNLVRNATLINDTILQYFTNGLQSKLEENMAALITETYERLIKPFTEMKTNLLDPVDDMLEQINDLDELLTEYKMSTKMNTHFFM